jgi:histidinol dehydrogenase
MPLQIRHLDSTAADFRQQLTALLAFEAETDDAIESAVATILADVRKRGDAAVLEYTNKFDRIPNGGAASMAAFDLTQDELQQALAELPPAQRAALQTAASRIRVFHERQKQELNGFSYTEPDGTVLGQRVTPLDRVGIYVPGGKAAYPSSVLMNAIPAQVAGVKDIVMVVPTPDGVKNRMVLAAAAIAGVTRVITIGGAQAVAALAYGTETIPAVDKIVGPGNAYVAAAKRRVFGTVGIDMIAGPSEILVLCDGTTDPDWVAMDLFSQAEHDELAQAILLCPDAAYIAQVEASIHKLLPTMPRKDTIATSLSDRGALVKVRDMEEACEIANAIAAEHLEISAENPQQWADKIRHAGAMFLGRFSSPLGVYDFQKRSSILFVSEAGAQTLGRVAAELAYGEGLQAHARSAELRIKPAGESE